MSSKKKREEITLPVEISRELYDKFRKDIGKKTFKFITPYMLALQYSIKISTARKLLKIANKQGLIKLYSGGRRTPIYIIE
uniref:30S ribosomal protein S25e n=1 Tax=Staphylothermus marinus TaxID=2280 RepID=A0A7C4HDT4_STAMA